jgi:release factor glutamine methyltransferase
MTLGEASRLIHAELAAAGVASARTEAHLLLSHGLGISSLRLYAEPERRVAPREAKRLRNLVERRVLHEPLAYILHRCEFCGIELHIDRRVFIPRPETEYLVEKMVECVRQCSSWSTQVTIADIGTGCGAIAVNLALGLPQARILATDISVPALQLARLNCRRHGVESRVELLHGSLLTPLLNTVDAIVANLPYVTNRELRTLDPQIVDFEPIVAIAGGDDGLGDLRLLLAQASEKLRPGGCIVLEIGQGQDQALSDTVTARAPRASIEFTADLAGTKRVACLRT